MKSKTKNKLVVIRTINAGIHIGELVARKGDEVQLANARRLWRWAGANTLHEIALRGAEMSSTTRLSEPVESITVLQVIEIIPVASDAAKNLTTSRWL